MPFSNLLFELIEDFTNPRILWQAAIIGVCVACGWLLARLARNTYTRRQLMSGGVVRSGIENFAYVLTPLVAAALIALSEVVAIKFFKNVNLLRVALPIVASLAVIRLVFFLLHRVFARGGAIGAAVLTFEKIFALLVWLGVALYISGLSSEVFAVLQGTTLPLGRNAVSLAAILQALISVGVLLVFALWAGAALEERLMNVQGLHVSLRVATGRIGRAVLILVAVLVSLSLVGIDLTVLSVFGGALGVGLGLGLQKIASNYVSGFVILLERSLAIGDVITVDRYSGKVTSINTRYTILLALDGTESVLPNEMLISSPVQNLSLSSRETRVATQLTVAFDTDVEKLLPLLEQECAQVERVLADPPPFAMLNRFGADGFELEVGMWINDPENGRGALLSEANRRIWALLQREGVTLPYATRDLRFAQPQLTAMIEALGRTDVK